jgi:hypothetical protein
MRGMARARGQGPGASLFLIAASRTATWVLVAANRTNQFCLRWVRSVCAAEMESHPALKRRVNSRMAHCVANKNREHVTLKGVHLPPLLLLPIIDSQLLKRQSVLAD